MTTPQTDATGFYEEYRAPWHERIWRWFGYRHAYQPRPEETAEFPSYMVTVTRVHLSILDRLRLLVSGRLDVEAVTQTDVEVRHCKTQSHAAVVRP